MLLKYLIILTCKPYDEESQASEKQSPASQFIKHLQIWILLFISQKEATLETP